MRTVELTELGRSRHPMTAEQGHRLRLSGLVKAVPATAAGIWDIGANGKVGAVRIGDVEVRIHPKLDIRRLLFLAGYALDPKGWRDEEINLGTDVGLVPAVANALWRLTERALRQGLLQGYREVEETSYVLRGRLRETDQLRRHQGRAIPMELRHDDFTADIPENRVLLAAIGRMLMVPRVDPVSQRHLAALRQRLAEVAGPVRGPTLPDWRPNRLNARYHTALRLAEIVWEATSPEHAAGALTATGFLFDLPTLFERFVSVALAESLPTHAAGYAHPQFHCSLDDAGIVRMRPDLVWQVDGNISAVVDAKYKREERSGYPNEDIYQMLAYCAGLGTRRGHLVYAAGNGQPVRHVVRHAAIEIVCHAIDLTGQPAELLRWIDELARELTGN
jgi:5-methylcytosine-specific restriction enzyme subunit McrC